LAETSGLSRTSVRNDWVPSPHKQPRYRHIADELRRRITAGAIPAGALIPSEPTLMREFGVARGTVREAIALLRNEGTVTTEHGRGTLARPATFVRRPRLDMYKTTDLDSDVGQREIAATPELAALFEIQSGAALLERRLLITAHGIPQRMATLYCPLDLILGPHFADQVRRWSSNEKLIRMRALESTFSHVRETVSARMPTATEIRALSLPAGTPVLTVARRAYIHEKVAELAYEVVPADRSALDYEIFPSKPSPTIIA
jgi:GntR family transcriptional regulator